MILLFATAAAASTVPAQLDAILKDYDRADAPGASVLVAQGGKVLYRKAFGLANLGPTVDRIAEVILGAP